MLAYYKQRKLDEYSALPISHSYFSHNNSQNRATHSSPVRVRYGCLSWVWNLAKVLLSKLLYCVQYCVVLNCNTSRVEKWYHKRNNEASSCLSIINLFISKTQWWAWAHSQITMINDSMKHVMFSDMLKERGGGYSWTFPLPALIQTFLKPLMLQSVIKKKNVYFDSKFAKICSKGSR